MQSPTDRADAASAGRGRQHRMDLRGHRDHRPPPRPTTGALAQRRPRPLLDVLAWAGAAIETTGESRAW